MSIVQENTRKLASVVRIDAILKHPKADRLEIAMVGGWQCCVKIGEFKANDTALYCEIDSMLPTTNPAFAFLEARGGIRTVNEVPYARVKTIKLQKEISQGLLIPLPEAYINEPVGTNLTAQLGVMKYDPPAPVVAGPMGVVEDASLYCKIAQLIRGSAIETIQLPWPSQLTKTDEERVQNIHNAYQRAVEEEEKFEITYKLEGSSMTVFALPTNQYSPFEYRTGVCSRNAEISLESIEWSWLRQFRVWVYHLLMSNRRMFRVRKFNIPRWVRGVIPDNNEFVMMYNKLNVEDRLIRYLSGLAVSGGGIAIQGELIGPGIRKNYEGVPEQQFHVYGIHRIWSPSSEFQSYKLLPKAAKELCDQLGFYYVPIFDLDTLLPPSIKECLALAEGSAAFSNKIQREGLVFKSMSRDFSFKAISNAYLLKNEE